MMSEFFPKTHARSGEPTNFFHNFQLSKIHTIRGNYEYWYKRMERVKKDSAYISVRRWTGKPYATPQEEMFRITAADNPEVEMLQNTREEFNQDLFLVEGVNFVHTNQLSKNDGLSVKDFKEWFKETPTEPMAIIHFTEFRYHRKDFQMFLPGQIG